MREWWNTPAVAWGFLAVGIGAGVMIPYLPHKIGIPICVVLIFVGICLLIRAYRNRAKLAVRTDIRVDISGVIESLIKAQSVAKELILHLSPN